MNLALFQPDIAQNTATLIRLGACLGVDVHIIEPCGFVFSDKNFRRAGMDYLEKAAVTRHASWTAFLEHRAADRIALLTTTSSEPYTAFAFQPDDSCCSAARAPACRMRSMPPQMRDSASLCATACVPSMSPSRGQWFWVRP